MKIFCWLHKLFNFLSLTRWQCAEFGADRDSGPPVHGIAHDVQVCFACIAYFVITEYTPKPPTSKIGHYKTTKTKTKHNNNNNISKKKRKKNNIKPIPEPNAGPWTPLDSTKTSLDATANGILSKILNLVTYLNNSLVIFWDTFPSSSLVLVNSGSWWH